MRRHAELTVIAALCWLALTAAACALGIEPPLPDAAQEMRAKALFRQIRCVVCEGESIADSPAQIAGDMRRAVRDAIARGSTDEAITDGLVSQYGSVVLMRPPFAPSTYLLWFGPLLIVGYGAHIARQLFRKRP
jgi:cytochrome c-type biogenesis protein CcmH